MRALLEASRLSLLAGLVVAGTAAAQDLRELAFLELHEPPANFRDSSDEQLAVGGLAVREDGLVFVGGRELHVVHVVDARDPSSPSLVCSFPTPDDTCALALDPDGTRLWIGGDDRDVDGDGLSWTDVPADPFSDCSYTVVPVSGVESGVTPNPFVGDDGRRKVLVAGRFCLDDPVRIVDVEDATPVVEWTWGPSNPRMRTADASLLRASDGRLLAAVAADFGGAYVFDLTGFPGSDPVLLAHFDWTYVPPDFDGDPSTVDGCDRNGDGDVLECGEPGRAGDGRRTNACNRAVLGEVDGRVLLVTTDVNIGGHVHAWWLDDVLSTCPGADACPDDVDCQRSIPQCPPTLAPETCPPWPDVDRVAPVARYQLFQCPINAWNVRFFGDVLVATLAEGGVHVIDLGAQALPPTAGAEPVELVPLADFDTLPGDSDTVLENYPCHPVGEDDGCESQNRDWNPTPCQPSPPPDAAFRVVVNGGLNSAIDATWSACRTYVADQGSPDADGLPAPSHEGAPQGLWVLELADWPPAVGASLRVARSGAADLSLTWDGVPLVEEHRVLRDLLPETGLDGLSPECVARSAGEASVLAEEVTTDAGEPRPSRVYLVVAACGATAGSSGTDSAGAPRPGPAGACP